MFAIGEQRRTAAALFNPLAVFFQNKLIVIVPRSAMYFRIVTALPLHNEML